MHAGKRTKSEDFPEQREYVRKTNIHIPEDLPLGAIIGEVTIVDCLTP